jgi:hypothetical protein
MDLTNRNNQYRNIRDEYNKIIEHYLNLLSHINNVQLNLTQTQVQINRRMQNVTSSIRWLPRDDININNSPVTPARSSSLFTQSSGDIINETFNQGQTPTNLTRLNVSETTPLIQSRTTRRRQNRRNTRNTETRTQNQQTNTSQTSGRGNTTRSDNPFAPSSENVISEFVSSNEPEDIFRTLLTDVQNINTTENVATVPINNFLSTLLSGAINTEDISANTVPSGIREVPTTAPTRTVSTNIFDRTESTNDLQGSPLPFPQFPFPQFRSFPRDASNNTHNGNMFATRQPFTATFTTPNMGGGGFFGGTPFENVPVFPSAEQIETATRMVSFQEIEDPINNTCPITMESFSPGQIVMQITHCGHIFNSTHLHSWFRTHVKCPVCRHDIRESQGNIANNNDVSGNNINTSFPPPGLAGSTDIEQPASSLDNARATTPMPYNPLSPLRNQLSLLSLANAASRAPPTLTSQITPTSSSNSLEHQGTNQNQNQNQNQIQSQPQPQTQTNTYTFNPPITTFNTTTAQNGISLVSEGRIIHTDPRLGELTAMTSITENILRSMMNEVDISGNIIPDSSLANQTNPPSESARQDIDASSNVTSSTSNDISGGQIINGEYLDNSILESLGYLSQD